MTTSPLAEVPVETPGHGLLAGKKVVVTAAAGTGIGFATARRALLEGGDVLVSDFHERRLGETVEKLAAEFPQQQVASIVCDVSSTEQVTKVEIFINGKLVGTATQAPWTVTFEAGDQNILREIKAVVHGASGATATHTVVTSPVHIDDQLDLRLQQLFVTVTRGQARTLDLDEGDFGQF